MTRPISPADVARDFDPARLTQARRLHRFTKADIGDRIGVTAGSVGQYEAGVIRPRPHLIPLLADLFDVPADFFLPGRPHRPVPLSAVHFRDHRSTPLRAREAAAARLEQVFELCTAIERRVQFPFVDLPGFSGELQPATADPATAAHLLRARWQMPPGAVAHLVRLIEAHGIIVTHPHPDDDTVPGAYSTSHLPRPVIVVPRRLADDVYRFRFHIAHELGHLVLHPEARPDARQEREADKFAAEFLTPAALIRPQLPHRIDFTRLTDLQNEWGVSVKSLLIRHAELGLISATAFARAGKRWKTLRDRGSFPCEPAANYPGEVPALLPRAFDVACDAGADARLFADTLAWRVPHVRALLGVPDTRPALTLVT